jgi:hypothetical protein
MGRIVIASQVAGECTREPQQVRSPGFGAPQPA